MSESTVRVRFAPSPTGHLHVGGARTAVYNWLFARHAGGRFILRIDDTDPERSLPEYTKAIMRGLTWLGLDWDEGPTPEGPASRGDHGPYFQSLRMDRYREVAGQLLDDGAAYRCWCTPDEFASRREQALKAKRSPSYDRRCRDLPPSAREEARRSGMPFAIRLAVPLDGDTSYDDVIRGHLAVANSNIEDFVILRSDGTPTYNFASAVDDVDMAVTHVIRGDDHISNTPKQILIAQALEVAVPIFAHLPMIWGPDKTRLSKRHGATSIEAYRDAGYLPEALLNFLALLGWSADATTTLFSAEELVTSFTLDRVSSSPAVFDNEKLDWMNGDYIRRLPEREYVERAWPFLEAAGLTSPLAAGHARPHEDEAAASWWKTVALLTKKRVKTLAELPELVRFLFVDVEPDDEARAKALADPAAGSWLDAAAGALKDLPSWQAPAIEHALRQVPETLRVKPKAVFQALRAALTGRLISPPLFESIELLGRETTLRRLAAARRP